MSEDSETQKVENKLTEPTKKEDVPIINQNDASKFVSLENLEDIKNKLKDGTDINITDDKGNTLLHTNAAKNNLDIIKYILHNKGEVNKQNNDGDTPLTIAGIYGNLRAVKLLIKNGADTDIKNNKGLTPLESVIEFKKQGNTSQDIDEVINFLEKDKQRDTSLKNYYDTPELEIKKADKEKAEKEKAEKEQPPADIESVYDDSHIDNDDDLENTEYNITWKKNKTQIKALYSTKGITQELLNYGNNLILFYEKKIEAVKELIERKSSDSKKNFVGDTTIQDEQRKNIPELLINDSSTRNMTDEEKLELISGYTTKVGDESKEVMKKDYDDRNRTIKYLLLIREYQANIESIQKAIEIKGAIQLESSDKYNFTGFFDDDWDEEDEFEGGGKIIMRGGDNIQINNSYKLLLEEYGTILDSPINDPELKIYLLQYLDKLQFLIGDPANVDIIKFREVSRQLLEKITFLKETEYGGHKGGTKEGEEEEKGFFGRLGDKITSRVTRTIGLNPGDEDDDPVFFGSHEIGNNDTDEEEIKVADLQQPMNNLNALITTSNTSIVPDSPEAIAKFVDSNNIFELDKMLNDGLINKEKIDELKIVKTPSPGSTLTDKYEENAWGQASLDGNFDKIWFLLSRGSNINQKIRTRDDLLKRLLLSPNDNSSVINILIRLGASKDGINPSEIPNETNRDIFNKTNLNQKDYEETRAELNKYVDGLIERDRAPAMEVMGDEDNNKVKRLQRNGPPIGKNNDSKIPKNIDKAFIYPGFSEVQQFVKENNLLELTNMLSNEYINGDVDKWAGDTAWGQAQANGNLEKIYWLISKGANINQKIRKESTLLEKAAYDPDNDWSKLITDLIKLGASKDGIDPSKIKNSANKKAFTETNYTQGGEEAVKEEINQLVDKTIHDIKEAYPSSSLEQSDPNHPLYRQWKAVEDAEKKRNDNFTKWGENIQELDKSVNGVLDNVEKIKKGELEGPQKYEDNKKTIEDLLQAQLNLVLQQTKTCIDGYSKQTNSIRNTGLKIKQKMAKINKDLVIKQIKLNTLKNEIDKKNLENMNIDIECGNLLNSLHTNATFLTGSRMTIQSSSKKESKHDRFVRLYIETNYVKKNLYEFINQCRLLDSIPKWRAMITTLMVGYLTSYVDDPNQKNKHVSVMPSYDYFNLVLQGTPGVGKSYSSAIVGKALKWCGFLTVGKMKEVKKPDIVGSYTGQTAPKVYNELTQGLGNIVFIDEAYSIAGAKDETKGTFNEFGQEALDAITDYTSEHIGLLAFIVAGYEYEMQNQFLNVNIGLPRRFPTVLTLRRYDMKSFWKILEMPIIKFCPKYQVDHHHRACFELLNIMFNFQWTPNPVLQLSKKWSEWWESYNLKNLTMNLKVNMLSKGREVIGIPFVNLNNFDEKIKDIQSNNITATSINVLPLTELIGGVINMETATFVKSYFIYKFCGIRNGDFFRSQADNLTKFGQLVLEDKIINPSKLFVADQDKNQTGNKKWIEYIYFNLYFTKNPNKPVENIKFSFENPQVVSVETLSETTSVNKEESKGGSKIKQYTKKNMKSRKYTRRNNDKNNKKTIHKYQNKKNKKTIRQRGGDIESDVKTVMNYYINSTVDNPYLSRATKNINTYIESNPSNTSELRGLKNLVDNKFKQLQSSTYGGIKPENKKLYKEKLNSILTNIKTYANPPVDATNPPVDATNPPVENTNTPLENTNTPIQIESPPPIEIKPTNLSTEIQGDFSTLLNYYVDPSISETDLNNAYKNMSEKLDNLAIDDLKNIYVLASLRWKQLKDPFLKLIPSKNLELIIKDLNVIRNFVNKTLTKKDKTFKADKLFEEVNELLQNPAKINDELVQAIKAWPEFEKKLELKENLNVVENLRLQKEKMEQQVEKQKRAKDIEKAAKQKIESIEKRKTQEENAKKQKEALEENAKKQKEALELLKKTDKDLVFDIIKIDFSAFSDTQDITENIVRSKMIDNEINNKIADNEKLKTIFVTFMKKYNEYLGIYIGNIEMNEKQRKDLPIFVYTYLLLACYNTSFMESKKPLTKFNNDSWWFFTADDFKVISKNLDIEKIIDNFNKIIGVEPEITPENKDIKEIENVAQEVAEGVKQGEVETDVKVIEKDESKEKE